MIIHSIVPIETIFDKTSAIDENNKLISYRNEIIEVSELNNYSYRINRILTTNLSSYLDPKLQPGAIISTLKHSIHTR